MAASILCATLTKSALYPAADYEAKRRKRSARNRIDPPYHVHSRSETRAEPRVALLGISSVARCLSGNVGGLRVNLEYGVKSCDLNGGIFFFTAPFFAALALALLSPCFAAPHAHLHFAPPRRTFRAAPPRITPAALRSKARRASAARAAALRAASCCAASRYKSENGRAVVRQAGVVGCVSEAVS
jgi:hypothetical protein